jgi:large subunit ribosomal protein L34e
MVSGKYKSRTYARSRVRTPGGKNVLRHTLRKPKAAHCAGCGAVLHGMVRLRPVHHRRLSKSQKVPSRPFAGTLCSACTRQTLVAKARK